jgi:hypothetical protein
MATFGKTSVGGSWNNSNTKVYTTGPSYSPASNGTITSISFYCRRHTGTGVMNLKLACYKDVGGVLANAILVTSGVGSVTAAAGWKTVNVSNVAIFAANSYYFAEIADTSIDIDYAAQNSQTNQSIAYASWGPSDPHGAADSTDTNYDFAAYATYTEAPTGIQKFCLLNEMNY